MLANFASESLGNAILGHEKLTVELVVGGCFQAVTDPSCRAVTVIVIEFESL